MRIHRLHMIILEQVQTLSTDKQKRIDAFKYTPHKELAFLFEQEPNPKAAEAVEDLVQHPVNKPVFEIVGNHCKEINMIGSCKNAIFSLNKDGEETLSPYRSAELMSLYYQRRYEQTGIPPTYSFEELLATCQLRQERDFNLRLRTARDDQIENNFNFNGAQEETEPDSPVYEGDFDYVIETSDFVGLYEELSEKLSEDYTVTISSTEENYPNLGYDRIVVEYRGQRLFEFNDAEGLANFHRQIYNLAAPFSHESITSRSNMEVIMIAQPVVADTGYVRFNPNPEQRRNIAMVSADPAIQGERIPNEYSPYQQGIILELANSVDNEADAYTVLTMTRYLTKIINYDIKRISMEGQFGAISTTLTDKLDPFNYNNCPVLARLEANQRLIRLQEETSPRLFEGLREIREKIREKELKHRALTISRAILRAPEEMGELVTQMPGILKSFLIPEMHEIISKYTKAISDVNESLRSIAFLNGSEEVMTFSQSIFEQLGRDERRFHDPATFFGFASAVLRLKDATTAGFFAAQISSYWPDLKEYQPLFTNEGVDLEFDIEKYVSAFVYYSELRNKFDWSSYLRIGQD